MTAQKILLVRRIASEEPHALRQHLLSCQYLVTGCRRQQQNFSRCSDVLCLWSSCMHPHDVIGCSIYPTVTLVSSCSSYHQEEGGKAKKYRFCQKYSETLCMQIPGVGIKKITENAFFFKLKYVQLGNNGY